MPDPDPREIVRRGYDALSYRYRADQAGEGGYAGWLDLLRERLPARGAVLDLGCGAGVPVARALAAGGFTVTGVDLSDVQIRRARPLEEQPGLLGRIGGWLRPGGWLLATTGQEAWTGTEEGWLGGSATMWWSHADAATYRDWIARAGLEVTAQELVPEGAGGHALFWARRPLAGGGGGTGR
jgi:SAM-dependent methyltransferase